jgi:hypothetical protein
MRSVHALKGAQTIREFTCKRIDRPSKIAPIRICA